jgi:hypothetical protein
VQEEIVLIGGRFLEGRISRVLNPLIPKGPAKSLMFSPAQGIRDLVCGLRVLILAAPLHTTASQRISSPGAPGTQSFPL